MKGIVSYVLIFQNESSLILNLLQSFNEIVSGYEKKTGKKLDVSYTSQDELKETLAKNPADVFTFLRLALDQGISTIGEKNANDLFPEWNPKKVLDIIV